MSTQTIPPPTATFNVDVFQWVIFDEYQVCKIFFRFIDSKDYKFFYIISFCYLAYKILMHNIFH